MEAPSSRFKPHPDCTHVIGVNYYILAHISPDFYAGARDYLMGGKNRMDFGWKVEFECF